MRGLHNSSKWNKTKYHNDHYRWINRKYDIKGDFHQKLCFVLELGMCCYLISLKHQQDTIQGTKPHWLSLFKVNACNGKFTSGHYTQFLYRHIYAFEGTVGWLKVSRFLRLPRNQFHNYSHPLKVWLMVNILYFRSLIHKNLSPCYVLPPIFL